MASLTVNPKLVPIGLAEVDTIGFERFGQAFYGALMGRAFVPLGGMHDGGAEGYLEPELFEDQAARQFLQVSKQENYRRKIRETVARIRGFGRQLQSLTYLTSETISNADREEEKLSEDLDCRIRIRDGKYIETQINSSEASIASFNSYILPSISHLLNPGDVSVAPRTKIYGDPTLAVFLRQEVEHRSGNSNLLQSVADALIIWSLSDTDPQAARFMTRDQILVKVEEALPSARHFFRGVIGDRLARLSSKADGAERQIRYYRSQNAYCLPFTTREAIKEENVEDAALRLEVTEVLERRFSRIADESEAPLSSRVVSVCHAALERIFELEGLRVAQFASNQETDDLQPTVDEVVARIIEEGNFGNEGPPVRRLAVNVLGGTFRSATDAERKYLERLSRTYVLLLLLKNEPKIVEYFKSMSGHFNLYLGTDFLVSAISEQYLPRELQYVRNLIDLIQSAGAKVILTEKSVKELATHLRGQILEYENHYLHIESMINLNVAEHIDRELIKSYFFARLDPIDGQKVPSSWRDFIEQFASYHNLMADRADEELARYLTGKFGFEYESAETMVVGIEKGEIEALASEILRVRGNSARPKADILAYNDALQVLRIYQRRRINGEASPGNPFGFRTWWLTKDAKVRRAAAEFVAKNSGHRFMMRPEFLLHFLLFSPSKAEVERSYRAIFPSIIGMQLSNRLSTQQFKSVLKTANEVFAVDEARASAMITGLVEQLKGDMSKQYDLAT